MARSKQTARKSTGGKAPRARPSCNGNMTAPPPPVRLGSPTPEPEHLYRPFKQALDDLDHAIENLDHSGAPCVFSLNASPYLSLHSLQQPWDLDVNKSSSANGLEQNYRWRVVELLDDDGYWEREGEEGPFVRGEKVLERCYELLGKAAPLNSSLIVAGSCGVALVAKALRGNVMPPKFKAVAERPSVVTWVRALCIAVEEKAAASSHFDTSRLPVETLSQILSFVPRSTLCRASLVCRAWSEVTQPLMHQKVELSLSNGDLGVGWLASLASRRSRGVTTSTTSFKLSCRAFDSTIAIGKATELLGALSGLRILSLHGIEIDELVFDLPGLAGLSSLELSIVRVLASKTISNVQFSLASLCVDQLEAPDHFLVAILSRSQTTLHTALLSTAAQLSCVLKPLNGLVKPAFTDEVVQSKSLSLQHTTYLEKLRIDVTQTTSINSLETVISTLPSPNVLQSLQLVLRDSNGTKADRRTVTEEEIESLKRIAQVLKIVTLSTLETLILDGVHGGGNELLEALLVVQEAGAAKGVAVEW